MGKGLSVVIPVYNVENYLKECLESVIHQTNDIEGGGEVILVDDGSTDSSGTICDHYAKLYPDIIKVFHNENQGLLMTRRFGYQKSCGEYILNCDSDDTLEDDAIQCLSDIIRIYNRPDMIIYNYNYINGENKNPAFENVLSNREASQVSKKEVVTAYMRGYQIVSMCGTACRRSCIDVDADYSGFGRFGNGEDSLQKLEQLERANTFVYLNRCLYNYRMGTGMTCRFDPDYFIAFSSVFEEIDKRKVHLSISNVMFAEKVLCTIGRSITQLRYGLLRSYTDWKGYLKDIRNNRFFEENIAELPGLKSNLQKDYVLLLRLLKDEHYLFIYILLFTKNQIEKIKLFGRKNFWKKS